MGCKNCKSSSKKIDYEILNTSDEADQDIYNKCKNSEKEMEEKNISLDIPEHFKELKIKKIYLGFKSSYKFYEKNKRKANKRGYEKKTLHILLFMLIIAMIMDII